MPPWHWRFLPHRRWPIGVVGIMDPGLRTTTTRLGITTTTTIAPMAAARTGWPLCCFWGWPGPPLAQPRHPARRRSPTCNRHQLWCSRRLLPIHRPSWQHPYRRQHRRGLGTTAHRPPCTTRTPSIAPRVGRPFAPILTDKLGSGPCGYCVSSYKKCSNCGQYLATVGALRVTDVAAQCQTSMLSMSRVAPRRAAASTTLASPACGDCRSAWRRMAT